MNDRIHDVEADTGEETARSLLADQCPQWAGLPLRPLQGSGSGDRPGGAEGSGTSNALWRIHRPAGNDLVLRLPRLERSARGLATELSVLPRLARRGFPVDVPRVHHAGEPTEVFPHPWAVLGWIAGQDAWAARRAIGDGTTTLAEALAAVVRAIADLADQADLADLGDGALPVRRAGERGGPLLPLLDRLDRWLDDPAWNASALVDIAAVRRVGDASREVAEEPVESRFVHGDLIPGNLLLRGGTLSAVIDWGSVGVGDPAQDFAPAWSVLDGRAAVAFRDEIGADDAAWARARAFELEHAVGGVLYYRPRRHPLADVMDRTLVRILADG